MEGISLKIQLSPAGGPPCAATRSLASNHHLAHGLAASVVAPSKVSRRVIVATLMASSYSEKRMTTRAGPAATSLMRSCGKRLASIVAPPGSEIHRGGEWP
jgi:hypothetical protein